MEKAIADYFAAWNEPSADARRELLDRAFANEPELVEPRGRWRSVDEISGRIAMYLEAMPETRIELTSGVDAHNDVCRYGWRIVDSEGTPLMEGIDVAEAADDGRLRRVVMFHGPLPAAD